MTAADCLERTRSAVLNVMIAAGTGIALSGWILRWRDRWALFRAPRGVGRGLLAGLMVVAVASYAVRLVAATRPGEGKAVEGVHKYLLYGASPRASQFLVLGAKARAILAGKYHVDFEDVRAQAGPVLRHRLVLNFHARADGVDADAIIRRLLEAVRQEG